MRAKDSQSFVKALIEAAINSKHQADSTIKRKIKEVIETYDGILGYHAGYIETIQNDTKVQCQAIGIFKKGFFEYRNGNGHGIIFLKDVSMVEFHKKENQMVVFLTSSEKRFFGESFFALFSLLFNVNTYA
jgi:hypothetical protein